MPKQTREPKQKRLAAVVLNRVNYGEADLIVSFLTRELGLINALARYGRRSIRRFGGGLLSPGVAAWFDFTIKPSSSLAFVEKGEEDPNAPRLAPDPVMQSLAAFSLEIVRGFEAPGNPAEEGFNLLLRHLGRLAQAGSERQARLTSLDFALKYMELAGFGPRLSGCLLCGAPPAVEAGWRWEPAAGGLYCPHCSGAATRSRPLSRSLLARFTPKEPGEKHPILENSDLVEAEIFFEKLAEHHLGHSLKSMKIARRLFTYK